MSRSVRVGSEGACTLRSPHPARVNAATSTTRAAYEFIARRKYRAIVLLYLHPCWSQARPAVAQNLFVERLVAIRHAAARVGGAERLPRGGRQRGGSGGILQRRAQGRGEPVGIARRHQPSTSSFTEDRRDAAHAGGNDRAARPHRLEHG